MVWSAESIIPYVLCVIFNALGVDRDDLGDSVWRGVAEPLELFHLKRASPRLGRR
jgi:hypothetical protein